MKSTGLVYSAANGIPRAPGLLILGEADSLPASSALDIFLRAGGRVVLLGESAKALGFSVAPGKLAGSSLPPAWPEVAGLSPSDLRLKTEVEVPLLAPGTNEIAANGLLGRRISGKGVALAFALTPDRLPAREKTYLRFSQWRFTRALSQILANLGGTFRADSEFLNFVPPAFPPIPLAGSWRINDEILLPPAPSPGSPVADPGRDTAKTNGWETPNFADSSWKSISLPGETEKAIPSYADKDGAFWFRRTFDVPEDYAKKTLLLNLGPVDDFDDVWINGTRIGGIAKDAKDGWSRKREYKIRPGILAAGANTIVVRCFDQFGGGGFTAINPDEMRLELATPPVRDSPYVAGFREDHELGDDPARYYRW